MASEYALIASLNFPDDSRTFALLISGCKPGGYKAELAPEAELLVCAAAYDTAAIIKDKQIGKTCIISSIQADSITDSNEMEGGRGRKRKVWPRRGSIAGELVRIIG